METYKKIVMIISLMALILFSGCSSYEKFRNDCVDNSEIQKELFNKTLPGISHYDSEYYEKLERYCMGKYSEVEE